MSNYTTTLSVGTRARLVRLVRAVIRNVPGIVSKIVHIAERAVLAWEAYSIAVYDLAPPLAPIWAVGFSWI